MSDIILQIPNGGTLRRNVIEVIGPIDFNGDQLKNLGDPSEDQDAATKKYLDNNLPEVATDFDHEILHNVGSPSVDDDCATAGYVQNMPLLSSCRKFNSQLSSGTVHITLSPPLDSTNYTVMLMLVDASSIVGKGLSVANKATDGFDVSCEDSSSSDYVDVLVFKV